MLVGRCEVKQGVDCSDNAFKGPAGVFQMWDGGQRSRTAIGIGESLTNSALLSIVCQESADNICVRDCMSAICMELVDVREEYNQVRLHR